MIIAPAFCQRFLGRQEELDFLMERFRDAANGRGSIVLVRGEAGVGKSRLLSEAGAAAERAGGQYAMGQCLEHTRSPLAPLIEILRELHRAEPAILSDASPVRIALARLMPELLFPTGELPPSLVAGDDRQGQYLAIAEVLRRFALERPLVAAVEDAHWADLTTLECLQSLSTKLGHVHAVVLVTYRDDEVDHRSPLGSLLGKIERVHSAWSLDLHPLSPAEMHTLTTAVLDARRVTPPPSVLDEIRALAEGNPLFAEELLKHAIDLHLHGRPAGTLPASVRAAVLHRLWELDERSRVVLMYAAVIGRRFAPDFLARITDLPLVTIVDVLRRARDLQLVVELRDPSVCYRFRHALVREALYAELLLAQAQPLHERIATELEALPDSEGRAVDLAYHWSAADNDAKAMAWNERAGDKAASMLAHNDAALFYERALRCRVADPATEAALNVKLGTVLGNGVSPDRSRSTLLRALAHYRSTGNVETICALSLQVGMQCWLLWEEREALEWTQQALEAIRGTPRHPLHHTVLCKLARLFALRGDPVNAFTYLDEAARHQEFSTPTSIVDFHMYRSVSWELLGERDRALVDGRDAIAVTTEATDSYPLIGVHHNLGVTAAHFGDIDAAIGELNDFVRLGRERFIPRHEVYCPTHDLTVGGR